MSVTQKQIAERLCMSQSHVARALKDDPVVSARSRQLVQATAREMGYDIESNHAARVMASKRFGQKMRKGVVAVIFQPEAKSPRFIPFYQAILNAIHVEAERVGVDVCICICHPTSTLLPRLVRDRNVDGAIVMNARQDTLHDLSQLDLPVVTFHVRHDNANSVAPDDYDGGCQATRHLLELGHREIAYFGGASGPNEAASLRFKGFRDTMHEHGVPINDDMVEVSLALPQTTDQDLCLGCGQCAVCLGWDIIESRFGVSAGERLPFTAMLCHNDPIAMSMVTQANAHGYQVPDDFSIVGFDDVSRLYRFQPELTSVDLGRELLGTEATRTLLQVIEADETGESNSANFKHVLCPVTLAVHASTAGVPAHLECERASS